MSGAAGRIPPTPAHARQRLLVTVTLNPNQLRAHIAPIADLDEIEHITLVADVPAPPLDKLRTVVPPAPLTRILGRAAAKLVVSLGIAAGERPRWVLAYNLVPHGLNALIVGALTRRRVLIHLIGGPREWVGGGWMSDNKVLGRLTRPIKPLEALLVWAIGHADVLAVMGTRARRDLIARGVSPDRVVVVPAGVDETLFDVPRSPTPRYHLVTASQLNPRKRLGDLLATAVVLKPRYPGLKVAIAGVGPLDTELRAEAERLGLEDTVEFLGFVTDMPRLYADSAIFVLPSRDEGLSIAICEAMAMGLPVVATDVGEVRDVVVPGENGELFSVGDVDGFVRATDSLLGDAERRAAMGGAATETIRSYCTRSRVAKINHGLFGSC